MSTTWNARRYSPFGIMGVCRIISMIIITAVFSAYEENEGSRESGDYRNVIFIIGDDHTKSAMRMNNHKLVRT